LKINKNGFNQNEFKNLVQLDLCGNDTFDPIIPGVFTHGLENFEMLGLNYSRGNNKITFHTRW
jgi:hypothetical protein